jgi:hypothetical protein
VNNILWIILILNRVIVNIRQYQLERIIINLDSKIYKLIIIIKIILIIIIILIDNITNNIKKNNNIIQ